jgi:hypothetical protein
MDFGFMFRSSLISYNLYNLPWQIIIPLRTPAFVHGSRHFFLFELGWVGFL